MCFIFTDLWVQSAVERGGNLTLAERLVWTYERGAFAMLITTMTTSASFFSNLASAIVPIREFGTFMGLIVLFNYLTVITLYPCALVLRGLPALAPEEYHHCGAVWFA